MLSSLQRLPIRHAAEKFRRRCVAAGNGRLKAFPPFHIPGHEFSRPVCNMNRQWMDFGDCWWRPPFALKQPSKQHWILKLWSIIKAIAVEGVIAVDKLADSKRLNVIS